MKDSSDSPEQPAAVTPRLSLDYRHYLTFSFGSKEHTSLAASRAARRARAWKEDDAKGRREAEPCCSKKILARSGSPGASAASSQSRTGSDVLHLLLHNQGKSAPA